MNHILPNSNARALVDRVRDAASALGCSEVWARASGPHVVMGRAGAGEFARVTPLGPAAFGLSFRRPSPDCAGLEGGAGAWDPVLLVDALSDVVEHALVGDGALALEG